MLATSHLRQGEVEHGVLVGRKALMLASGVKSKRVTDRMQPLQTETARQSSTADSRELSDLIRQHRSA
jgi:hypothetical protein